MWDDQSAIEVKLVLAGYTYREVVGIEARGDLADRSRSIDLRVNNRVGDISDDRELTYRVACVEANTVVVKVVGDTACLAIAISLTGTYVEEGTNAYAVS